MVPESANGLYTPISAAAVATINPSVSADIIFLLVTGSGLLFPLKERTVNERK